MEVTIKGEAKEIAALVLAVQERQKRDAREIELRCSIAHIVHGQPYSQFQQIQNVS